MDPSEASLIINTKHFHYVTNMLREFFIHKGFLECHTQNRLSILAACEDPSTISTFDYNKKLYPLPQTGQMWLEYAEGNYEEVADYYQTKDISHEIEQQLYADKGAVFFLKNFPEYTSPFWNMKRDVEKGTANKIDVILSGMETIGSAERSVDVEEMVTRFKTISDGGYAQILYDKFGKERVTNELEEFLKHKFITRSGGGIGITRLISSMLKEGLIPAEFL